jgi:hypothetical protein
MKTGVSLSLAMALSCLVAACSSSSGPQVHRGSWDGVPVDNRTDFRQRLLDSHNVERRRLGLEPLTWNSVLAAHARRWAENLASRGAFEHAKGADLNDEGENLWTGTANAFRVEDMMAHFLKEREDFKPGIFPKVSKTGNWEAVSHYTQIIWPTTREVGCALVSRSGRDWLVCRYAPHGNIEGRPVG